MTEDGSAHARSLAGKTILISGGSRAEGISDFSAYRFTEGPDDDLDLDFFLPDAPLPNRFG